MSEDRLQLQDTLDVRGLDDVHDEGATAPDHLQGVTANGVTDREQLEGETIDDRLSQEVPDPSAEADLADHDPSEGDATSEVEPASPDDEFHP